MPIYQYECDNCGLQFERTQKFTDKPITVCPRCHKKRVRKLLTAPGIVFKGSGWYATDHRSPSGASRKTHSGESGASDNKSSEKSESKAPASESKASSSKEE